MSEQEQTPVEQLPIDAAIAELRESVHSRMAKLEFLIRHRDKLAAIKGKPIFCGSLLDFDNLPHSEVVAVIRTIGGKGDKTPGENNTIHYQSRQEFDGFKVRCWKGQPPPSCKIVEVEEHVPEQIIPASVRKVRKLVCHPEVGAIIATARENGGADQQASQSAQG